MITKNKKSQYIYKNLLANQNKTASCDLVWVADFTEIKPMFRTLHIFLCIDIHTNCIIANKISQYKFEAKDVIRGLESAISRRFPSYPAIKPEIRLIIHTDRGGQFRSGKYNEFAVKHEDLFEPSMSREGKPKDNCVMERFVRTFKEHKIGGLTLEQRLNGEFINDPDFKAYRRLMTRYINSINNKANRKTAPESPLIKDKRVSTANLLMAKPIYTKAFSERFGEDFRRDHINNYKFQTDEVSAIINELAATAELVDNTPFDNPEINKLVKLFKRQQESIIAVLTKNPEIVKAHITEALEPVEETLETIQRDVKSLLPKRKKIRETQKLRDPLDYELFPLFLNNAGKSVKRLKELRTSQLRVCYTVLYYTGLRINEATTLTYQDLKDAFLTSQITVIHQKQKQSHIHTLSRRALRDLEYLSQDIEVIFIKYKQKYLFGKNKPMHQKSVIRLVNKDLKNTCHDKGVAYNIKSHSFRIYVISSLLKQTSVQNVADIIGHKDIRSTLKYARYALNKQEIKDLFDKLPDIDIDKID